MRSFALEEINRGYDEGYGHLPRYIEMVKKKNSCSIVVCPWEGHDFI